MRVAVLGYGATGEAICQALAARPDVALVGVGDVNPARAGARVPGHGVSVAPALMPGDTGADVVVIATTSRLLELAAAARPWLEAGVNVVSICEELGFPWRSDPDASAELDALAKRAGATLVGTGANPGFVMDVLPLALSAALTSVTAVDIVRTIDLADYGDLVWRFGLGAEPALFESRVASGDITGHIGFVQSLAHLAHVMALEVDELTVLDPHWKRTTRSARVGPKAQLEPGTVSVVSQEAAAMRAGHRLIHLTEYFTFRPTPDEAPTGDSWRLRSPDGELTFASPGVPSLATTVALTCNVLGAAVAAPAGLLTMSELPLRAFAGRAAEAVAR